MRVWINHKGITASMEQKTREVFCPACGKSSVVDDGKPILSVCREGREIRRLELSSYPNDQDQAVIECRQFIDALLAEERA